MGKFLRLEKLFVFFLQKEWMSLAAIIATGMFFAFFKLGGVGVAQTLWAEDGSIFISQARELGVSSLWVTYAGYFHFYPRLIAWLSSLFDLELTPLIFFSAWFLAYISLIYVITNRALYYKFNIVEAGLLVMLMLAQPHSGEVFFTLTNAQWFMGGALAIYVLVPVENKVSIYEKVMLLVAVLTGPFALLLAPILLLQLMVYRDWKYRSYVYILVGIGAIIQLIAILLSSRLTDSGLDKNVIHWITGFFNFMSFGQTSALTKMLAILFWFVFCYAVWVKRDERIVHSYESHRVVLFFLLLGIILFFMAGLFASKENPHWLSPLGWGARYLFIPYLLVFFAAGIAVLKQMIIKCVVYGLLILLSILSFSPFQRTDLQFIAFTKLVNVEQEITIPINPQIDTNSSWDIYLSNDYYDSSSELVEFRSLDLKVMKKIDVDVREQYWESVSVDSQLIFDLDGVCPSSNYIGVIIDIDRADEGWAQLFWSETNAFSENQSMRRFYSKGRHAMQFAFSANDLNYLRFDPLEKRGKFYISSINLYCLGE